MKKNLLLTALVGSVISVNAFAGPGPSTAVSSCPLTMYITGYDGEGNVYCGYCPLHYNNTDTKYSIEDCCINELTYDSESNMCVPVAGNSQEEPESGGADIASNASSATCDDTTIGATSGSTEMEAIWDANSITINWYNGNTKITTNTCSYDGAVTIPATPTKPGYTFGGWRIKPANSGN